MCRLGQPSVTDNADMCHLTYSPSAPRSACKPGSVPRGDAIHRVRRFIAPAGAAVIYLGRRLPAASSGLPGARTGRATPRAVGHGCGAQWIAPHTRSYDPSPLLGLAPGGGCLAARVTPSAGGLLHHLFTLARSTDDRTAVGARWRSVSVALSAGYPAWVLPSTVPCGARTFLTPPQGEARPPGQPGRHLHNNTPHSPVKGSLARNTECESPPPLGVRPQRKGSPYTPPLEGLSPPG